ncbi:MAG TPA: acyl-CoA dehydrogenase family protein, partial [Acidimicrobiia bacterium]|nr:acyl-CoA dehydrogenase family protein [Acidimicrobiia bacterium]
METAEFRHQLQSWLADEAGRLQRFRTLPNDLDGQFAVLRDLQRLLYDAGWLRHGWPEAVGGLGGSAVLRGVLSEELAAAGYPPPFSFGMMEVLAPAVARFAPQIAAWALPALLRGDEAWCQGFSEPEAGSDLGSLRLRASDEGDHWRVNGQKVWTSWAQYADRCILLARTGTQEEGHRGITA